MATRPRDQHQIALTKAQAAPLDYVVPNAQAIVPLAVNATFDGSGATGNWLPVLELYSDSGQVIARTFPSSPIDAGGSAECTFAPFLRDAGGGAGSGVVSQARYSTHDADPDQSVGAGGQAYVQWYNFAASDTSIFGSAQRAAPTVRTNTAGDDVVWVNAKGIYVMLCGLLWDGLATRGQVECMDGGGADHHHALPNNYRQTTDFGVGTPVRWTYDSCAYFVNAIPSGLHVSAINGDSTPRSITDVYLSVLYLGASAPETVVYGT